MRLIKLFIVLSIFESCCPKIIPQSKETVIETRTDTVYKWRDSLVYVPPIFITLKDNVNCDSLNRAQFKKRTIRKNGIVHSVEIKDGKLISHCNADSLKLLLKLKDKQINILKSVTTKETNNIEVFRMRWWETMFFWFGILFWTALIAIAAFKNFR